MIKLICEECGKELEIDNVGYGDGHNTLIIKSCNCICDEEIDDLENELSNTNDEINSLENELSNTNDEINSLENELDELDYHNSNMKDKLEEISKLCDISKIKIRTKDIIDIITTDN